MAYVYTEIELDDIRTDDLIEELQRRYLQDHERAELTELLKGDERAKMELFFKVKDKYSLLELHDLFQEQAPNLPTPKEQLHLFPAAKPETL